MKILLGSGGVGTPARKQVLLSQLKGHFDGAESVLFLPYAAKNHDAYAAWLVEHEFSAGYAIDSIHTFDDPKQAVLDAAGFYVGGGNTFRLLEALYRLDLLEPIRKRVLEDGIPYFGISAGANVACPTIGTTNDMPIVMPPSFDALDLVPFQVNPHFIPGSIHLRDEDGQYTEHRGETREDRIREFHQLNRQPVIGLPEGGYLVCDGDSVRVEDCEAHLFRPDQSVRTFPSGSGLETELGT